MNGIAVVLGGAACLWPDIRILREMLDVDQCILIAVNDAGFRWPGRLDHWVTLHPEELWWRKDRRRRYSYPDGYTTWTRPYPIGYEHRAKVCDRLLGGDWTDGSSGFLGVGVAFEGLGIRHIITAGIPMDGGNRIERPGGWTSHGAYRHAWQRNHSRLAPHIRSLSGWTKELYGAPSIEWFSKGLVTCTGE